MAEGNKMIDNVNHPPHYCSSNAVCAKCEHPIECIDVTRHLNFNMGNAIKYLWRANFKNGIEDLQKALWYINDEIAKQTPKIKLTTTGIDNPEEDRGRGLQIKDGKVTGFDGVAHCRHGVAKIYVCEVCDRNNYNPLPGWRS